MASNQTIAQIPFSLEDSDSLKRFFRELVDNLDEVLGYKGDKKYVQESDFEAQGLTLSEVSQKITELISKLTALESSNSEHEEAISDLQEDLEDLSKLLSTVQLGEVYRDFDNSAWNSLQGKGEFTADGSDLLNAPFTAATGTDYTVYVDSVKTSASVLQQVTVDSGADELEVFLRVGVAGHWNKIH